jgi:hypothetical protein
MWGVSDAWVVDALDRRLRAAGVTLVPTLTLFLVGPTGPTTYHNPTPQSPPCLPYVTAEVANQRPEVGPSPGQDVNVGSGRASLSSPVAKCEGTKRAGASTTTGGGGHGGGSADSECGAGETNSTKPQRQHPTASLLGEGFVVDGWVTATAAAAGVGEALKRIHAGLATAVAALSRGGLAGSDPGSESVSGISGGSARGWLGVGFGVASASDPELVAFADAGRPYVVTELAETLWFEAPIGLQCRVHSTLRFVT